MLDWEVSITRVFISYSRKDLTFVDHLASDLKSVGFEVWYDVSGLAGGVRWRPQIEDALRKSQFVIVVLSPDSAASEWVEREFLYSNRLGRKIIPLLYRECDLPLNYININYIDVQGEKYVQNFQKLLEALSDGTVTADTRPQSSRSRWMTPYLGWIGGGAIILAALLSLSTLQKMLYPEPTATNFPTVTLTSTRKASTDTPAPTPTSMPAWQQGRIVYIVRNTEKVYLLYIQDLFKGEASQLLLSPERPTESRYYSPWFAPDGKLLAYADRYNGKIFTTDLTKSDAPRPIGTCSSPSFSPDGTHVICDAAGAEYFPIYDVATGRQVDEVRHGKNSAVLPAWSPDGTEIVFSHLDENRDASIWKVSVNGGSPFPLATSASEDYAPAWSPDGEWIAYQSTQTSEKSEVWIMRRDGSEKRQVTFSGGSEIWSRGPCFSPDGQWLAFVSNQKMSGGADFGEVFVVSLVTRELHQVTDTGGYVYDWRVTWGK